MKTMDEVIRDRADAIMREVKSAPTPFWGRDKVMALVREIERLRRGPAPELTFWLGADA